MPSSHFVAEHFGRTWIGEHEPARFWLTLLTELKSRGVQDIFVVALDHLAGFGEAIATVWPRLSTTTFDDARSRRLHSITG